MKYFALLTFLIVAFYLIGFAKRPGKFQWMDRNYTTAIKGFSILTVVWAHSGAQLSVGRIQFIAGIGVALFLVCSGYGLEISYEKKGLQGFWKKRLLGVCLPFWLIEAVGLLITGALSVKTYLFDFFFLKPATGYGWFMGYIIICYFIFYAVKQFVPAENRMPVLVGVFVTWFVLESVFFADSDMPFLRARQMMSFPCGVLLAKHKEKIEEALTKTKSVLILMGGGTLCLFFMAVTQLHMVKVLPYLVSNMMAIFTCLPMAIGVLVFGKAFSGFFENKMLLRVGEISYEIYLVHAFTLNLVKPLFANILIFIVVTYIFAYILHMGMRKVKNDRFNSSYINKK